MRKYDATDVIPERVARALAKDPFWFVIGGHAVRCFCPYRPSDDVDFGVATAKDIAAFVAKLRTKGRVAILERAKDTIHLQFEGTDVSIFALPKLRQHTEGHSLSTHGVLATKLHAILDRGTRRDFFDLYVMLEQERMGLIDCLGAIREVYATEVNDGLVLRAVTYFDDAEREAPLPGEGPKDWHRVKTFFVDAASALVTPPSAALDIQERVVDVRGVKSPKRRHEKRR